jgi:heptosyltransferase-3
MNCSCRKGRYLTRKKFIRYLLYFTDTILGWIFHVKKRRLPSRITKILIIKPDHLGDMLLLTSVFPLIREKFPDAYIDILCGKWALPILANNPYIRKRIIVNHPFANRDNISRMRKVRDFVRTFLRAIEEIWETKYDLGLFMRSRRGNLLYLSRIGRINYSIGHGTAGYGPLLNIQAEWENGRHETEHFLEILRPLGIDEKTDNLHYYIYPSENDRRVVENFWKKNNLSNKKTAVVHPGSGVTSKTMKPEKWKEVIKILSENNYRVLLTGNKFEAGFLNEIAAPDCVTAAGIFTIPGLGLLFKKSSLIVTVDSLTSHLAGWSGVKTIIFFCGIGDMNEWRPLGTNINILSLSKLCSPCESGCPEMSCMNFDLKILPELINSETKNDSLSMPCCTP